MKPLRTTSEEVGMIKRAQAGDESAFTYIFKKYKTFVEKILFRYLKDKEEARDVTNLVFLKVYEKLSRFRAYDSFGGWLRVLTKNTAIDYLRTIQKQGFALGNNDATIPANERCSSGDEIINEITYKQILKMFDNLSPLKRKICYMFYRDGMRVIDISIELGVPTGTIKSVLSRTRKKLKNN